MSKELQLPVVLDSGSQARRVAGGIRAAAQRVRAERAGSAQSTLSSLSSLSATASLTDKLTASQYALGRAPVSSPAHTLWEHPGFHNIQCHGWHVD